MTHHDHRDAGGQMRLAPESVELLARRLAELLQLPETQGRPRRLLTAAEVSDWWGVDRGWVYAHAEQLGARRLGAGPRPRLRFDPDEVADRLGPAQPTTRSGAGPSAPMPGDPRGARFYRRAELSSPSKRNRPGGAPTPPATAPKTWPSAR